MRTIRSLQYKNTNKEELLPGLSPDFPYICSFAEIDQYAGGFVPWHWHREVELFYIKSGVLEYHTPKGKYVFPTGSGGMINANVLHMTKSQTGGGETTQLLHIFDGSLIGGQQGSRVEQKYVLPVVAASQLEAIILLPQDPEQARILRLIYDSFALTEQDFGYEMKLRNALSEIWMQLFAISRSRLEERRKYDKTNDLIKLMMIYVHEHYMEKISIPELAAAAFSSERECFRVFHDYLHMTPVEYVKSYRLQMACRMLAESRETLTAIGHACGLGSSSYFGKVFRECVGCTPLEYRRKWQNRER